MLELYSHASIILPTPEERAFEAELIVYGVVEGIEKLDNKSNNKDAAVAHIKIATPALKGDPKGKNVNVRFLDRRDSPVLPRPVALEKGNEYLLFLHRSGDDWRLSNDYYGAIKREKVASLLGVNPEELVNNVNNLMRNMKSVHLRLSVVEESSDGTILELKLRVKNDGDEEIRIPASLTTVDGRLALMGWTTIEFESLESPGKKSIIRGLYSQELRDTVIASDSAIEWNGLVQIPASLVGEKYRIMWRLGPSTCDLSITQK